MLDLLCGFVQELRLAGLPVALTEHLDAAEALRHVPLDDREAFKAALGATLVKNSGHWATFDTVFEIYFSVRRGSPADAGKGDARAADAGEGDAVAVDDDTLLELLDRALLEGDDEALKALARRAVSRLAGMEGGRPVPDSYYLHRTLRQLDLDERLAGMLSGLRARAGPDLDVVQERLLGDEAVSRLGRVRREIEAEIRRRLVTERGHSAVSRSVRRPLPEDVDFMHANREELAALRRTIQPLTRRLAVRLARRRRHRRRGPLDFRSTVRHSLSYGGVPAEPKFRSRRPARPEIVVVADISGSVAAFARFTLQLVHALASEFSKVRSFVFVDGIDEVTGLFERTDDLAEAVYRVHSEADVVWADGHSNYGHALASFEQRWGAELTPRTSLIVLGDARNNYHSPRAEVLGELRRRSRHLYWLNPEPRSYWDTGDSVMSDYAVYCDGVYECRNLRQLQRFITSINSDGGVGPRG